METKASTKALYCNQYIIKVFLLLYQTFTVANTACSYNISQNFDNSDFDEHFQVTGGFKLSISKDDDKN